MGTMIEVLGNLLKSRIASRVPYVKFDLLWLTVLSIAWHVHDLVLVLDSESRLLYAESVRHKLRDDGGLTDARVADQYDLSFWDIV